MTGRTHPVPRVSRRSAAPHTGTLYAGRRARNTAPAHPPDRLERGVLDRISRTRISRGRLSISTGHCTAPLALAPTPSGRQHTPRAG